MIKQIKNNIYYKSFSRYQGLTLSFTRTRPYPRGISFIISTGLDPGANPGIRGFERDPVIPVNNVQHPGVALTFDNGALHL